MKKKRKDRKEADVKKGKDKRMRESPAQKSLAKKIELTSTVSGYQKSINIGQQKSIKKHQPKQHQLGTTKEH